MTDSKYRDTDLANGVRFRELMKGRVLYDPDTDTWFLWDDRRWKRVNGKSEARVRELAREVVLSIDLEVARETNDQTRNDLRAWAKQSQSNARLSAMIAAAKAESSLWVTTAEFDTDPNLLNCMNWTIDLRTGAGKAHDPSDKITSLVPVSYDPNAGEPTLFLKTLNRAFAKDQTGQAAQYMLMAMGYGLRGNNSEQVAFFIEGDTNTGKTTVLEAVAEVLGQDLADCTIKPRVLAKNKYGQGAADTDVNKLRGRRFAAITEAAASLSIDEDAFKSLVGSGFASLRMLYGERFTVPVTWTLFVAANETPTVDRWEPAIARRMVVFDSGPTVPEPERDTSLKHRIVTEEAEQIVALLVRKSVEYERAYRDHGSHFNKTHAPSAVRDATVRVEDSNDHVAQFIRERLEFDPSYVINHKPSLYKAYTDGRPNGQGHTKQSFYKSLLTWAHANEHAFVSVDDRKVYGVRLRERTLEELAASIGV